MRCVEIVGCQDEASNYDMDATDEANVSLPYCIMTARTIA